MRIFVIICAILIASCTSNTPTPNLTPIPVATTPTLVTCALTSNMLWNPGPCWRASVPLDSNQYGLCDIDSMIDMSEAKNVGNPVSALQYCADGTLVNPGGYSYSYDIDFIMPLAALGKSPGWNVEVLKGGNGVPLLFRITDDAFGYGTDCVLREVSLTYGDPMRDVSQFAGWSKPVGVPINTVFKDGDFSKFSKVVGTFTAKLDSAPSSPAGCKSNPTNNIDNDIAVQYFDKDGKILRTDVLGIAIYDQGNQHVANTNIFFSNNCIQTSGVCQVILDGQLIGIPSLSAVFQNYNIEYLSLLQTYMPPIPVGTVSSKWIIYQFYGTSRDGSTAFEVTNINLVGTK